jgi:sugar phosphate isomerase/epimerase
MNRCIDRRGFLKATGAISAGVGLAPFGGSRLLAAEPAKGAPNAEKIGWRLGCQAYTFKLFTFYEAIEKTASLGLRYIEGSSSLKLSKDRPELKLSQELPADLRVEVKKKLADSGVKMVSYAGGRLSKDAGESRKAFDFAKDMGADTLMSEPPEDALETIDKLCEEYGINLAVHNHAKPSHYWSPDTVLSVCQGRSKRIGACADTGHWMRSGIKPLEALKKLEGRIISLHFKDLNEYGMKGHDVPWGTGVGDAKAMLAEIYRQKLKAFFAIEYEYNWENSLPEIAQCVAFFDTAAAEWAAWDVMWPAPRAAPKSR